MVADGGSDDGDDGDVDMEEEHVDDAEEDNERFDFVICKIEMHYSQRDLEFWFFYCTYLQINIG